MSEAPRPSKGFRLTTPDGEEREIGSVITDRFFEVTAPESVADLDHVLNVLPVEFGPTAWRGQANLTWGLHSSILRRVKEQRGWLKPHLPSPEEQVREAEARLLSRARKGGHDNDGEQRDLELLALLQHHGAGTRLLDCTRDPWIATWFACRDLPDTWGLLAGWALDQAYELQDSDLELSVRDAIDKHGTSQPIYWRPPGLSPRIEAQDAVFVFSAVVEDEGCSLLTKGQKLWGIGNREGIALVALSPALKQELVDLWDSRFVLNEERLFPDFDGFAQSHGTTRPFPVDYFEGPNLAIAEHKVI